MTWKDSLRKAICRRCEHNGTDYFTREQLNLLAKRPNTP